MSPFFGARMADLGDIRLVDLAGENSVLGLLSKGVIETDMRNRTKDCRGQPSTQRLCEHLKL
jgi:hypothetical protein